MYQLKVKIWARDCNLNAILFSWKCKILAALPLKASWGREGGGITLNFKFLVLKRKSYKQISYWSIFFHENFSWYSPKISNNHTDTKTSCYYNIDNWLFPIIPAKNLGLIDLLLHSKSCCPVHPQGKGKENIFIFSVISKPINIRWI